MDNSLTISKEYLDTSAPSRVANSGGNHSRSFQHREGDVHAARITPLPNAFARRKACPKKRPVRAAEVVLFLLVIFGFSCLLKDSLLATVEELNSPRSIVPAAKKAAAVQTASQTVELLNVQPQYPVRPIPPSDMRPLVAEFGPDEAMAATAPASRPALAEPLAPAREVAAGVVQQGDSVGKLLGKLVSVRELARIEAASEPVFALSRMRDGWKYAVVSKGGELVSFELELSSKEKLVLLRQNGFYIASREAGALASTRLAEEPGAPAQMASAR